MKKLTAANVQALMMDSLFNNDELEGDKMPENFIEAWGVMNRVGFHPERLESHRAEVAELLSQLPVEFNAKTGGGWSFLKAAETKDGEQWGEHPNIDELLMLGLGLGLIEYNVPRNMWSALPGGVPYFTIKENKNGILV